MNPPAPTAAPPTTRWPTSLAVPLIPRIWPRGICGWHLSRSLNSWQGSHRSATCPNCRSISFLNNLHSLGWPPPPWPPVGPYYPHLTLHPTSSLPWGRGPGSSPPPLTNNNNNNRMGKHLQGISWRLQWCHFCSWYSRRCWHTYRKVVYKIYCILESTLGSGKRGPAKLQCTNSNGLEKKISDYIHTYTNLCKWCDEVRASEDV